MGIYYAPSGLNVARPQGIDLRDFNSSLSSLTSSLSDMEKQKALNADREARLKLLQDEAIRKAQQDEYGMQMDAAKMGMTSDANQAQQAYNMAALEARNAEAKRIGSHQDRMFNKANEALQYKKDVDAGEIAGSFFSPVTEKVVGQKEVQSVVPDLLKEKYAQLSGGIDEAVTGPISEQDKQAQYLEFLKKTDPTEYTRYTTPLSMAQREEIAREKGNKYLAENFPNLLPTPGRAIDLISNLFSSESQADKDIKGSVVPIKSPSTPSYDEFLASQDFGKDRLTSDEATVAKDELRKALTGSPELQKEMGLTKPEKVDILGRTSEQEMYKDAEDRIRKYVAENPNVSAANIMGRRKAAAEKIASEIGTRAQTDKIKLERAYEELDTQGKRDFELYKLKLEDTLRNRLTPMEQVKLSNMVKTGELTEAKVEELKQKIKEGKSWF